ncbi:MAG: hypothetical protein DKINENOH_04067 [bacterium]|nr:hypothetical protein [bacterium]
MRNLFFHLARRHALFLSLIALLLGGFEYLLCAILGMVDLSSGLQELMKSMPPFLQSVISNQFAANLTTAGFLAFGWNHPIVHALATAAAIALAAAAIAGEIENGMIEFLLSQPISRRQYLAGQILFALFSLAAISACGILGTAIGQKRFALPAFAVAALPQIGVSFFLLQSTWYAVTLSLSAFVRERSHVSGTAFLLALVAYVLYVLGSVWPSAAFLLPFSLFHYYTPQAILLEQVWRLPPVLVLLGLTVAGLTLALWRFQRRDIP